MDLFQKRSTKPSKALFMIYISFLTEKAHTLEHEALAVNISKTWCEPEIIEEEAKAKVETEKVLAAAVVVVVVHPRKVRRALSRPV